MSAARRGRPEVDNALSSNLNVRLDQRTYDALEEAARAGGFGSRSRLVRSLIRGHLKALKVETCLDTLTKRTNPIPTTPTPESNT